MDVESRARITKIDHIEDIDSTSKNETTFSFILNISGLCADTFSIKFCKSSNFISYYKKI